MWGLHRQNSPTWPRQLHLRFWETKLIPFFKIWAAGNANTAIPNWENNGHNRTSNYLIWFCTDSSYNSKLLASLGNKLLTLLLSISSRTAKPIYWRVLIIKQNSFKSALFRLWMNWGLGSNTKYCLEVQPKKEVHHHRQAWSSWLTPLGFWAPCGQLLRQPPPQVWQL